MFYWEQGGIGCECRHCNRCRVHVLGYNIIVEFRIPLHVYTRIYKSACDVKIVRSKILYSNTIRTKNWLWWLMQQRLELDL